MSSTPTRRLATLEIPTEHRLQVPGTLAEILDWERFPPKPAGRLPAWPAVYCVVIDGTHLVYVGATQSLKKRWAAHQTDSVLPGLGTPMLLVRQVPDERARYWIELGIMQRFEPLLNDWPLNSRRHIEKTTGPDGRVQFARVAEPTLPPTPYVDEAGQAWVTTAMVAADFGVTRHAISKLIARGKLPAVDWGPLYAIRVEDVAALKASRPANERRGRPRKPPP